MKKHVPIIEITFEQLPRAVSQLHEKLESIEQLLLEKSYKNLPVPDELLTVSQAAEFLKLSVPTIYNLISKGEIPVMKRSKRCYFSKVELMDYIKAGRKKPFSELEAGIDIYLQSKKQTR